MVPCHQPRAEPFPCAVLAAQGALWGFLPTCTVVPAHSLPVMETLPARSLLFATLIFPSDRSFSG